MGSDCEAELASSPVHVVDRAPASQLGIGTYGNQETAQKVTPQRRPSQFLGTLLSASDSANRPRLNMLFRNHSNMYARLYARDLQGDKSLATRQDHLQACTMRNLHLDGVDSSLR